MVKQKNQLASFLAAGLVLVVLVGLIILLITQFV